MASIFSKIISGEIPCYKIAENDFCIAFLDVFPVVKGHTLIVPKKEVDLYFDLDEVSYNELNLMSKKVAKAIQKSIPCLRVGQAIVGLEVPHAHIHLIPLNHISDINFQKERLKLSKEEYQNLADLISSNLD